jgi:hypothetical protein
MRRQFILLGLASLLAAPAVAQAPAGWQMRVDRSTNPADPDDVPDVQFVTMGSGLHVTTGPAVTLWHPSNTASGTYTLRGTFTLMKPSGHVNYYGLVFGDGDLGGAGQNYLYFLVAQNGTYLVSHRAGDEVHRVHPRTPHDAVNRPDDSGRSTNALEVRVGAESVEYVVNGTVVHTTPRTGMTSRTDGVWGMRVNHLLDVHVEGLGVSR